MKMIDPSGSAVRGRRALSPRAPSLAGLTVGVLDNSKPNAGALIGRLAAELVARHGAGSVQTWRKPGSSAPATEAVYAEIASTCRVVLTGSAD